MTPGASFKVAEIIKPVLKSISESEPDINKLQKCTKLLATKYSFSHSHSCCHTTKVKCCKQFNFLLGVTCKHCSSKVQNSFRSSTHNSKKNLPKHSSLASGRAATTKVNWSLLGKYLQERAVFKVQQSFGEETNSRHTHTHT